MLHCSRIVHDLDFDRCSCCTESCVIKNKEKSKPGWFSQFFGKIFDISKEQKTVVAKPPPPQKIEHSSPEIEHSSPEIEQRIDNNNDDEDDEDDPLNYSLITISRYQKVDGYWSDLSAVQRITGLKLDCIDGISLEDKNVEMTCVATIIAIAAIRIKSANEKNSWIMIENKAVSWLKKTLGDEFDIQKVLLKVESLF